MKKTTRQFLRGCGSILNIWPSDNYDEIIPTQTVEQRINKVWERVGIACRKALSDLDNQIEEINNENRRKHEH